VAYRLPTPSHGDQLAPARPAMNPMQGDSQAMQSIFTGTLFATRPPRHGHHSVKSQPMNRRWKRIAAVATLAAVASTTACGAHQDRTTAITVYAASSLIKSFTAIGKEFQHANPGFSVEFVFSGSSDLSAALADGADADVFASGDTPNMTTVADAGALSGTPVPFARNQLVIITPVGNPGHVSSFADLSRPGLRVAVCAGQGACNSATELAEQRAGVRLNPQLTETTGSSVLKAVTTGQVDAGVVFTTDARAAGDSVARFALPADIDGVTSWIAVVKGTRLEGAAAQFMREVTGATGRRILDQDGFGEPSDGPVG
jgi:molybdate transport system substrate-binding protein